MITQKQRRNAERELTSTTCAGCDGPKERGHPFCRVCTDLVVEQGGKTASLALLTANLRHTAAGYVARLEFLLSRAGQRLRRGCTAGILLLIALFIPAQQIETVTIKLTPDTPTEVISRLEAEAQFKQLCTDGTDDPRLKALAVALNPMPNWEQFVINGDASVCNRNPKPIVPVPLEVAKQSRKDSK